MNSSDGNYSRVQPISLTYDNWALVVVGFIIAILNLWTMFGNLLVLISLVRFAKLRSTPNLLIGNLATSDLLLSMTVTPLSGTSDLLGYWVFGKIMCNIWLSLDVLYCTASIWGLVAIAFDRFTATVFPVWYRDQRGHTRVRVYILLVWLLSALICLPPLIGWNGQQFENPAERFERTHELLNNTTNRYRCILFNEPNYVIYSAMGSFILPLVIMIILYTKIFIVLQQRASVLRKKRAKSTATATALHNNSNSVVKEDSSNDNATAIDLHRSDDTASTVLVHNNNNTPHNPQIIIINFLPPNHQPLPLVPEPASPPDIMESPWELREQLLDKKVEEERSIITTGNNDQTNAAPPIISREENNHFFKCCTAPDSDIEDSPSNNKLNNNNDDDDDNNKKRRISTLPRFKNKLQQHENPNNLKADRREQRATKRMALIIALFVLCWIPFTLMYIIRSLCGEDVCRDYKHLTIFVIWLGYANSGLNPILYTIFNLDFREAFGTILCGRDWMRKRVKKFIL